MQFDVSFIQLHTDIHAMPCHAFPCHGIHHTWYAIMSLLSERDYGWGCEHKESFKLNSIHANDIRTLEHWSENRIPKQDPSWLEQCTLPHHILTSNLIRALNVCGHHVRAWFQYKWAHKTGGGYAFIWPMYVIPKLSPFAVKRQSGEDEHLL